MNWIMLLSLVGITTGLGLLWWSGDLVVRYAILVASRFQVTTFFVGFVVLALAADIPEIAVAISSALRGVSEVSAGDIVGANFSDVAFVLGLTLFIAGSMGISKHDRKRFLQLLLIVSLIMFVVFSIGTLTKVHGIVLVAIYLVFMLWGWYKKREEEVVAEEAVAHHDFESLGYSKWGLIGRLFASLGLVLGTSMLVVHCAVEVAMHFSMPLEVIGATLLGMGTSLPELVVSLSALKRKEYGLALGPTLGTVLCQGTLILGLLSLLSDKPINLVPLRGAGLFMFVSFFILSYSLIKESIGRRTGFALLSLFICYWAYHFMPSVIIG